MKYYQLTCSRNENEIGFLPQAGKSNRIADHNDPLFPANYMYVLQHHSPIIPPMVLHTDAKETDLLSSSVRGAYGMLMNNKLRSVLERFKIYGIQFFPVPVETRSHSVTYWLPNPYRFDFELLDYQRTSMSIIGQSGNKITDYSPKTSAELCSMIEFLKPPQIVSIDFPVFIRNCKEDVLILRYVDSEPSYYVSENVKTVLDAELCSGIELNLMNSTDRKVYS